MKNFVSYLKIFGLIITFSITTCTLISLWNQANLEVDAVGLKFVVSLFFPIIISINGYTHGKLLGSINFK